MPKGIPPARYRARGVPVTAALQQHAVRFRSRIIDALVKADSKRVWYLDEDTLAGTCPLCSGVLSVYFHGTAPRADLICRSGCGEMAVAGKLSQLAPRDGV
jgi:hypothetical protein